MSDTTESQEFLTPGPEVEGDPYWAIMNLDAEGHTTANIWTHGGRITLFESRELAERLLEALSKQDPEHSYGVRGVTERHYGAIEQVAAKNEVALQIVTSIDDKGTVEARLVHPKLAET